MSFIGSDSKLCKLSVISNMHTCMIFFAGKTNFFIQCFVLIMMFVWGGFHLQKKSRQSQTTILKYMFGAAMEPKLTSSVTWEWTDPCVVGESMVFFIHVS